jgi:hypothetical protein
MPPPNGNGAPAALKRGRRRRTPREIAGTVALTLAALAGLNLVIYGFVHGSSSTTTLDLPAALERLIPVPNSQIRVQDDVGADLRDDFTGVLVVDGNEIPEDQLLRYVGLGQVYFRPGEGKDLARFAPGRHSVTVVYWKQTEDRATSQSFTWQFTAA